MLKAKSRATPTSWFGIAQRCFFTLLLTVCTYNPTSISLVGWISQRVASGETLLTPLVIVPAILFVAGWAIVLVMAWRAYRWFGRVMVLVIAMLALYVMYSAGLMDIGGSSGLQWCIILIFSVALGYSTVHLHVRRKLFGVVGTSEVEDSE